MLISICSQKKLWQNIQKVEKQALQFVGVLPFRLIPFRLTFTVSFRVTVRLGLGIGLRSGLGELGLGEMGLCEMGQNQFVYLTTV